MATLWWGGAVLLTVAGALLFWGARVLAVERFSADSSAIPGLALSLVVLGRL